MNTYETVEGTEPAPLVTHKPRTINRVSTDVRSMMSEIGDGLFAAWDMCARCTTHVGQCACKEGPQEPVYITRWRDKRFQRSFKQRPTPEMHDRKVLADVVRTLQKYGYTLIAHVPEEPEPLHEAALASQLKQPPAEGWGIDLTEKEADDFTEALNPNIEAESTAPRNSTADLVDEGLAKAKQAVEEARSKRVEDQDAGF